MNERYELAMERIRSIAKEETVALAYRDYFQSVAKFILEIHAIGERLQNKPNTDCTLEELKSENERIYSDVIGEHYETSYANPAYAVSKMGEEVGRLLSLLYTEIRSEIPHVYEKRMEYLTICNELFIEIYNCFEGVETPDYKELASIVYWYASDYCDVFMADRIEEQLNPDCSFATDIIMNSDLSDLRYLYFYGEYVSENEWKTAEHLNTLPQETIDCMADVYTEGYRKGFELAGIDLSKKSVVNIRYQLGFERVIKKAIENFAALGLRPTIYRAATNVVTKKGQHKIGFAGGNPNKQYDYDHRADQGLFLDKKLIERKLDVMKNTYEQHKELASQFAGPAVMEVFGEQPFAPIQKAEAITLNEKQEQLTVLYDSKGGQLTNQYIKGDERSFTIVAYPIPEIGKQYPEIFNEIIRINTLDADLYEKVQQTLIDALDQGEYVHVLGKGDNVTDLKIINDYLQISVRPIWNNPFPVKKHCLDIKYAFKIADENGENRYYITKCDYKINYFDGNNVDISDLDVEIDNNAGGFYIKYDGYILIECYNKCYSVKDDVIIENEASAALDRLIDITLENIEYWG